MRPSFITRTSFSRKLTCLLKGGSALSYSEAWEGASEGGGGDTSAASSLSSKATCRSKVAMRASFVSSTAVSVAPALPPGRPAAASARSSCTCSARSVSAVALSSCQSRETVSAPLGTRPTYASRRASLGLRDSDRPLFHYRNTFRGVPSSRRRSPRARRYKIKFCL